MKLAPRSPVLPAAATVAFLALAACQVNVDNKTEARLDNAADAIGARVENAADQAGAAADAVGERIDNAADGIGNRIDVDVDLDGDRGERNQAAETNRS